MNRRFHALAGALLAACPVPVAIAASGVRAPYASAIAGATTACLALAGLLATRHTNAARAFGLAAIAGVFALLFAPLRSSPSLTLVVLLAVTTLVASFWRARPHSRSSASARATRARSAAMAAFVLWVVGHLATWMSAVAGQAAMAASFAVVVVTAVDWALHEGRRHPVRRAALAVLLVALAVTALISWGRVQPCLTTGAFLSLIVSFLLPLRPAASRSLVQWWEPVLSHPERLLVSTFLVLCIVGAVALLLPAATTSAGGISPTDASFTSVSAVCVTGLIVLDTPVDFTPLGQSLILVLIQLGGIGIMAFSAIAFQLLGRRMSLRHEGVVAQLVNAQDRSQLSRTTYRIIWFTFAVEAVGALLLLPAFVTHGDEFGQALWRAVFTSVSAFCNAGFALQSDNLVGYARSPLVLHVVGALIVLGGLSPAVAIALPRLVGRGRSQTPVEAKIAVLATVILLVAGALFILASEWSNTLGGLRLWDRIHNAWFQSVTLRTAGFNSVDIGALQPATVTLMIVWMFIGGCPGGTAGGIKTTTAAVLLLALVSAIRGRWIVTFAGRRLSHTNVYRAGAVATLGLASLVTGLLALQLTQSMPAGTALFEVTSALGTVGLSMGGTPLLDGVGKVIIIWTMFIGRVGPLTLFLFLADRQSRSDWQRPEAEIEVG